VKKIKLTRGKFALVDNRDYDYLMQWNWYSHHGHCANLWYARTDRFEENRHRVFMHAIVAECMGLNEQVDHIDTDGLNNQRSNLRLANGHNNRNRKLSVNNKSGYKGVCWRTDRGHWTVTIVVDNRTIYVGSTHDKKEAARMYNVAAVKYHGEFANLNKV